MEVYEPYYCANRNYYTVEKALPKTWSRSGLDSCKRVAQEIYKIHSDELDIKESTAYAYTIKARNVLYGNPSADEPTGRIGKSEYVFCKKNIDGTLAWLSLEEEQIRQELMEKWFGDRLDFVEKALLVQGMVEEGEIEKEEAWEYLENITSLPKYYKGFMREFQERTGITLVRGTMVDNYFKESAF